MAETERAGPDRNPSQTTPRPLLDQGWYQVRLEYERRSCLIEMSKSPFLLFLRALPRPSSLFSRLFPSCCCCCRCCFVGKREKTAGRTVERSRFERGEARGLSGLNWNCHVRESEANQKKNNLYRIEFNCDPSIL